LHRQKHLRVLDGGRDLEPVPHNARVREQLLHLGVAVTRHFRGIEPIQHFAITLALLQDDVPAQPGLRALQNQELEPHPVIMHRHAPLLVMVANRQFIARPGTPLLHRRSIAETALKLKTNLRRPPRPPFFFPFNKSSECEQSRTYGFYLSERKPDETGLSSAFRIPHLIELPSQALTALTDLDWALLDVGRLVLGAFPTPPPPLKRAKAEKGVFSGIFFRHFLHLAYFQPLTSQKPRRQCHLIPMVRKTGRIL
jgi:hypothetical protein